MAEIIAFVSPKGGCGATTVCALVCNALSGMGLKVLGVDMCFEDCSLDFALGRENDYVYTLADVINGNSGLEDICSGETCAFLRCDYDGEGFDYTASENILRNSGYDYILLDCSVRYGVPPFADKIAVITDTSPVSVRFCEEYVQTIGEQETALIVNKIVPGFMEDGIHPNVDEILDSVGCTLLGLVPMDMYVNYTPSKGLLSHIDDSCLFECFSNIAQRITGKRTPAYDIDAFFDKCKAYKYLTKGRK